MNDSRALPPDDASQAPLPGWPASLEHVPVHIREALEVEPGFAIADSHDFSERLAVEVRDWLQREPRLGHWCQRLAVMEQSIRATMPLVEPPAGMSERLMVALSGALATVEAAPDEALAAVSSDARDRSELHSAASPPSERRPRLSRRVLFLSTAGALAATLLVAAGVWWTTRPAAYTAEQLVELLAQDFANPAGRPGQLLTGDALPPDDHPASGEVLYPLDTTWRELPQRVAGRHVVAFDLSVEPGRRATLYAIRVGHNPAAVRLPLLSASTPTRNPSTTQNRASGVWQEGEVVYVLVVEGGRGDYLQYLPPLNPLV